jgi:hypothetical protein
VPLVTPGTAGPPGISSGRAQVRAGSLGWELALVWVERRSVGWGEELSRPV